MKIFEIKTPDNKELKIKKFQATIQEDELETIYNKLFSGFSMLREVSSVIIDNLLHDYIKATVADKFIKEKEMIPETVYSVRVTTKDIDFVMMISKNDKLREIFY